VLKYLHFAWKKIYMFLDSFYLFMLKIKKLNFLKKILKRRENIAIKSEYWFFLSKIKGGKEKQIDFAKVEMIRSQIKDNNIFTTS